MLEKYTSEVLIKKNKKFIPILYSLWKNAHSIKLSVLTYSQGSCKN